MKYLLIILILTSCAYNQTPREYKRFNCIDKFVWQGISPDKANDICADIYGKRY